MAVSSSPPLQPLTVVQFIAVFRDPAFLALLVAGPLVAGAFATIGIPLAPAESTPWLFVLAFPIAEELTFRGLVQGQLARFAAMRQRRAGISGANVVATLLFAAAHLPFRGPSTAALVLLPSLTFGWIRDRHCAVWPAALLHMSYNASAWVAAMVLF